MFLYINSTGTTRADGETVRPQLMASSQLRDRVADAKGCMLGCGSLCVKCVVQATI